MPRFRIPVDKNQSAAPKLKKDKKKTQKPTEEPILVQNK